MLPTTEPDITAFIAAFENGTLPKERWTHSAHILGGAWFVYHLGETAALDHMRLCVQRYNIAVGGQNTATSGYHETVTVFWIKHLQAFLETNPHLTRTGFANLAVAHFTPQRDIYTRHYDFDIITSTEARAAWLPPNLTPITP